MKVGSEETGSQQTFFFVCRNKSLRRKTLSAEVFHVESVLHAVKSGSSPVGLNSHHVSDSDTAGKNLLIFLN